ncbi:MAG: hypothetical protein J6D47_11610, partial [Peptostreptococcaceae bacterium]|nr:hypothetical protein [Peptostreptococcaceae bacterium]
LENKLYKFITDRFTIGISYTEEHLKLLANEIKEEFKLDYTTNKLSTILNQIYIIESIRNKKLRGIDNSFYRNILPNPRKNEKYNYHTIKSFISISDLEKELHLENDNTIGNMIERRKSKYINQLSEQEKEVLQNLEGVF